MRESIWKYHWTKKSHRIKEIWVGILLYWLNTNEGHLFCIQWVTTCIFLMKLFGIWANFTLLRYKDAISLLKQLLINFTSDGRRGYWTLRLSIDLEHVGCLNESLLVAEDGLLDPWVRAGSRTALQRRVLRLGKPPRRWKIPSFSESIKRKIPEVIANYLFKGRAIPGLKLMKLLIWVLIFFLFAKIRASKI